MPQEAIEQYIAAHHAATQDDTEVFVLEENWNFIQVYRNCKWDVIADSGQIVYTGVSAPEIESVARMMGVKADCELLEGIRFVAGIVRDIYNARKAE